MGKILKYAKENRNTIYLALFFVFIGVISGIIPYFITNNLIQRFIIKNTVSSWFVLTASAGIITFLIIKAVTQNIGMRLSHKAAYNTLFDMRKTFCDKLSRLPLGIIQNNGTGYYKKKIVEDIESMEIPLAHIIPEMIPNIVVPIFVLLIVFIKDWRMGLLSMASIPFGIIPMMLMLKTGVKKMPKYFSAQNRLNNNIIEYISGMEVIKIFGQTDSSFEKYENSVKNYIKYSTDWTLSSCKGMAIVTIVLPCTIILTLPVGLYMYFQGMLSLQTLIFTLMITMGIGVPFNRALLFIPFFPRLNYAISELENVFFQAELKTGSKTDKPKSYDIEFDKVSFSYEEKTVINDVSFSIKESTMTAIVGPSGGGKSTLAKLLVHYYDIDRGEIKIGGENITGYTQEALMEMISFVSQDSFLFDDPIIENIRKGRQNATDEEIMQAAKMASAHDFIMGLENGYQTVVGSSGGKLSGGERQRIAIARAILKDSPIIVLDEAMAHSDAENEDLIQDAINRLMKEKTVIVIAHRLRSIMNADTIMVINKGRIIEKGSHDDLMRCSDLYQQLWSANEKSYNWELEV